MRALLALLLSLWASVALADGLVFPPGATGSITNLTGPPSGAVVSDGSGALKSSPVFDIVAYGAVGDGVTVNNTPVQAAFIAAAAVGGRVHVPCGTFKLSAAMTATIAAGKNLTLDGDGDCSILYTSGADGLDVTWTNQFSSFQPRNLQWLTDDTTGSFKCINASLSTPVAYQAFARNVYSNVMCRGLDYASTNNQYWGVGYNFSNVSYVDIGQAGYWGAKRSVAGTVTIGASAVITANNNFVLNAPVVPTSTGTLPTGLTAGKIYYVLNPTSTSFQLATVPNGTALTTSGTQSGTHTFTVQALGTAINYAGLASPASYAIVLNVHGFQSQTEFVGLSIGDYVQGVTVDGGTNFTNVGYGVTCIGNPTGTPDEMIMHDSQIASYVSSISCAAMNGLSIHHDVLIVQGGNGIDGGGNNYVIDHNFMQATNLSAGSVNAIDINKSSSAGGSVDHNQIQNFAVGIENLVGTYSFANIDANVITSTTTPYLIASGNIGVVLSDPTLRLFSTIPPCNAGINGARMTVYDNGVTGYNTAVPNGGGTLITPLVCGVVSGVYNWYTH